MKSYYELLGVEPNATSAQIKKAYREKAKKLHPDIVGTKKGSDSAEKMRKLITAYEVLSSAERRYEYDKVYSRFVKKNEFDYKKWLTSQDDPVSQCKLIFFLFLHSEDEEAISVWRKNGGLSFNMKDYMDREDWMDCQFILGEELDKRGDSFEAFKLIAEILGEERRCPYFKLFTIEIEGLLKNIVRLRLKSQVDKETWLECMEIYDSVKK